MITSAAISALLDKDELGAAITAATQAVKTNPQDVQARGLLAELSVLAGDLDRAEAQAKLAARLAPGDAVGLGLFRQYLRGLHAREQWWTAGAVPAFPGGMTKCDRLALKLNVALRAEGFAVARAALDELEEARGARTPVRNMPEVLQLATLANPLRFGIDLVRRVYLEGAGLSEVAPDFVPMCAVMVVTLPLAGWLFRHRLS